jgi:hypothetical protein
VQAADDDDDEDLDKERDDEDDQALKHVAAHLSGSSNQNNQRKKKQMHARSATHSFDVVASATVSSAIASLLRKIEEYRQILDVSVDLRQQRDMCEMICSAAASIEKLKSVEKHF